MDKVYLAPCPFCAGLAKKDEYDPYDGYQGNNTVYRVKCRKCGAEVRANSRGEAIRKWNRRAAKLCSGTPYDPSLCKYPVTISDEQLRSALTASDSIFDLIRKLAEPYIQEHPEERSE